MILTSGKAGVIAGIVAGVVEYTHKRDRPVESASTLRTDVTTWFNNDLHGE